LPDFAAQHKNFSHKHAIHAQLRHFYEDDRLETKAQQQSGARTGRACQCLRARSREFAGASAMLAFLAARHGRVNLLTVTGRVANTGYGKYVVLCTFQRLAR
jgi:hypothetical protein